MGRNTVQRVILENALDTYFFTADWHIGHKNILRFCDRPFATIEEHDKTIIKNVNETVGDGTCYVLGDSFWNRKEYLYISSLAGNYYFLPGSHDGWMDDCQFAMHANLFREEPLLTLNFFDGTKHPLAVVLCHYALRTWDRSHYGSLHLYGHSHGDLPSYGRSMDVGVDVWDYRPVSLRTVLETLSEEEPILHHRGEAS